MSTIQPTRFFDAEPLILAGLEGSYSYATIPEISNLWHEFVPKIDEIPSRSGIETYGLCIPTGNTGFRYLAAIGVAGEVVLDEPLTTIRLPAARYAVFVHTGPISELSTTIGAIWNGWLPKSEMKVVDPPHMLEVYGLAFDPVSETGELELWVPIRP